jgi:hypothetical protein
VSRRTANQVSSVRRIAQITHKGRSVVDGALADVAKGARLGGRDNHATSLGQSDDADESGQPGHWRHANWPMKRISTSIPALQQGRLAGAGHAALSSWHIISAGMTQGLVARPGSFVPPS